MNSRNDFLGEMKDFLYEIISNRNDELKKGKIVKGTFRNYRDNEEKINSKYRRKIVDKVSKYIKKSSKNCDTKLSLSFSENPKLIECIGKKKKKFKATFDDGQYLVLQNENECFMSYITLTNKSDSPSGIIYSSETVDDQLKKGYNILLRTVLVMIAFVENLKLTSISVNPISAYTLVKNFACELEIRDKNKVFKYSKPLTRNKATDLIDNILFRYFKNDKDDFLVWVTVPKTAANLKRALEIFYNAIQFINCFED